VSLPSLRSATNDGGLPAIGRRCTPCPSSQTVVSWSRSGWNSAVTGRVRTGRELWRARLGGNYSASPIYASGRRYFFDDTGETTVLAPAPEHHVLATNHLDSGVMASPAVSGDALYLHTKAALYRIEDE